MKEKISKQELIEFLNSKNPSNSSNEKNIEQVLYFTLIWNAFEGSFFLDNEDLNNDTLGFLSQYKAKNHRYVNELYNIFRNRYVCADGKKLTGKFEKLRFCRKNGSSNENKNKDIENFVRISLLATEEVTPETKIKVILLIIYRFRNNLFHGAKTLFKLNHYQDIFGSINKFMICYIKDLIDDKHNIRKFLKKSVISQRKNN